MEDRMQKEMGDERDANGRIVLPLPPEPGNDTRFEMEVYARFMRHLRCVPHSGMDIRILSSMQFTADMMDTSDALIAKTLVDLGLRAPRRAFPIAFLDFADRGMARASWETGSPPASVARLYEHWGKIGDDQFHFARRTEYALCREGTFAAAV